MAAPSAAPLPAVVRTATQKDVPSQMVTTQDEEDRGCAEGRCTPSSTQDEEEAAPRRQHHFHLMGRYYGQGRSRKLGTTDLTGWPSNACFARSLIM